MRYWLTVIILITANLIVSRCAEAADCYANPRAVWREHPHAHPVWRYVDHRQCWRATRSSPQHASRERHHSLWGFGMVSLPPRIPLPPLRYDRLLPEEGARLSHELLGD